MIELLKAVITVFSVFAYTFVGLIVYAVISDDDEPDFMFVVLWLPIMVIVVVWAVIKVLYYCALSVVVKIYDFIRKGVKKYE